MKTTSHIAPEVTDFFVAHVAPALQRLHDGGSGESDAVSSESPAPVPQWPDVARHEHHCACAEPMRDANDHPLAWRCA